MKTKTDKSLQEVWDMKENVYNDFKKSKFLNFNDFIESEMIEIRKRYKIEYYYKEKEEKSN